jgi:plasmid stability protein
MANLTITVDDQVLKKARLRALEQGTSVNALLREYLDRYAGAAPAHAEAVEGLIQLAKTVRAGRGRRTWTRDELHER